MNSIQEIKFYNALSEIAAQFNQRAYDDLNIAEKRIVDILEKECFLFSYFGNEIGSSTSKPRKILEI